MVLKENERFEQVVAEMQRSLSPKANIIHNTFLVDKITKTRRQVDVLIEDKIGQIPIKIVIECKYHSRRISIGEAEEFIKKLQDIGVQRGVMVSKKGFTKPALEKLKSSEIIPYLLYDSKNPDLSSSFNANVIWHNKVIIPSGYKIAVFNKTNKDIKIKFSDVLTPLYNSFKKRIGALIEITKNSFENGLLKEKCNGSYTDEKITNEKMYLFIDDNMIEIEASLSFECKIEHYYSSFSLNQIRAFYDVGDQKIHTSQPIETKPILLNSNSTQWRKLTSKNTKLYAPVFEVDTIMFNSPPSPIILLRADV